MLNYEESVRKAKNGVMIELINIGEGMIGDYNENNPEDTNLLRFDVYTNASRTSDPDDENWESIDSWCTLLPATMSEEKITKALDVLFNEFYDALKDDLTTSIRRLGDNLSWTSEEDIEKLLNKTS